MPHFAHRDAFVSGYLYAELMPAMTNCLSSASRNFKLGATKCCNLCKEMQQPSCQPRPIAHLCGYFLCCRKQFRLYFFLFLLSPLLNVGHKLLHTVRFVWFGFVSFCSLQFAVLQHISVRCPLLQLQGFHSPSLFMLSSLYSYINTCCAVYMHNYT